MVVPSGLFSTSDTPSTLAETLLAVGICPSAEAASAAVTLRTTLCHAPTFGFHEPDAIVACAPFVSVQVPLSFRISTAPADWLFAIGPKMVARLYQLGPKMEDHKLTLCGHCKLADGLSSPFIIWSPRYHWQNNKSIPRNPPIAINKNVFLEGSEEVGKWPKTLLR